MSQPLLEVKNLRVEFPTRRGTLLALDDISFDGLMGRCVRIVSVSCRPIVYSGFSEVNGS